MCAGERGVAENAPNGPVKGPPRDTDARSPAIQTKDNSPPLSCHTRYTCRLPSSLRTNIVCALRKERSRGFVTRPHTIPSIMLTKPSVEEAVCKPTAGLSGIKEIPLFDKRQSVEANGDDN